MEVRVWICCEGNAGSYEGCAAGDPCEGEAGCGWRTYPTLAATLAECWLTCRSI